MNLPSQGEINGFITGSGGMILKFPVQEKMYNGSLGVGEFGSNQHPWIETAFKGQPQGTVYL